MAIGERSSLKAAGLLFAVILVAAAAAGCRRAKHKGHGGGQSPQRDYHNVVLVGWDGARRDRFQKLLAQGRLPNARRLIDEGGWASTEVTTGNTQTKPGWAEILTGYSAVRLGIASNRVYRPIPAGETVFERLRAHFGKEGIVTIFLGSKTGNIGDRGPHEIVINALSRNPDTHAATNYLTKSFSGPTEDGKPARWVAREGEPFHLSRKNIDVFRIGLGSADNVGREAVKVLTENRAKRFFAFVHFGDPDELGHLHGESSPRYEEGLCAADAQLGVLMKTLKELGIYDRTLLYLTTDHGFDKGGFAHNHAPETFLATNSRRILRKGDRKDVTPTLLEEFGVDRSAITPPLDGKSMLTARPDAKATKPLRIGFFLGGRTAILMRMLMGGEFEHRGLNVALWTRALRDDRFHAFDIGKLDSEPLDGKATGIELIDGMLAGKWELSTPGESSFLAAAAEGKPVVAVAMLGHDVQGNSGHLFALRHGLRLTTPKDYLGKLLISRRAGPGDIAFLLEYLGQEGVDLKRDSLVLERVPKTMAERDALPKDKVLLVYNVLEDDLSAGVRDGIIDGGFFHLKPFENMTSRLEAVESLHHWANPALSLALIVCSRDFLKVPANRSLLKKFFRAYLERIRYEKSLSALERTGSRNDRWRAMDSPTPGFNYPQHDDLPIVDAEGLKQMTDLLIKHRLLVWKDTKLKDYIDDSLLREAAAEMSKAP